MLWCLERFRSVCFLREQNSQGKERKKRKRVSSGMFSIEKKGSRCPMVTCASRKGWFRKEGGGGMGSLVSPTNVKGRRKENKRKKKKTSTFIRRFTCAGDRSLKKKKREKASSFRDVVQRREGPISRHTVASMVGVVGEKKILVGREKKKRDLRPPHLSPKGKGRTAGQQQVYHSRACQRDGLQKREKSLPFTCTRKKKNRTELSGPPAAARKRGEKTSLGEKKKKWTRRAAHTEEKKRERRYQPSTSSSAGEGRKREGGHVAGIDYTEQGGGDKKQFSPSSCEHGEPKGRSTALSRRKKKKTIPPIVRLIWMRCERIPREKIRRTCALYGGGKEEKRRWATDSPSRETEL